MTTEQRLKRLERENKWMRRIGVVAVAVAAAVFLIGQGKDKELPDLEVRSLKVKDKDGKVRCTLGTRVGNGAGYLSITNEAGTDVAALFTDNDGLPALVFMDKDGFLRTTLGFDVEGAMYLSFYKDHRLRAVLGTDAKGSTELTFYGAERSPSGSMTLSTDAKGESNLESVRGGDTMWKVPKK